MELLNVNDTKIKPYFKFYDGKIQCDPILLLHGFTGSVQHHFSYEIDNYSKIFQTHVFTYDLRSHGLSDISKNYELDIHFLDLENIVKQIRDKFHIDKLIVLGASFGGGLAIRYAISHPTTVSKLILISTTPQYSDGIIQSFKKIKATLELFFESSYTKLTMEQKKFVSILQKIHYDHNTPFSKLHYLLSYVSLFLEEIKYWSWIEEMKERIIFPVLIIHGDKDFISATNAKAMHDILNKSKLVILKNFGHLPQRKDPLLVQKFIERFLKDF